MREFKEFTPLPNEPLEALSKAQIKGIITGREGGVDEKNRRGLSRYVPISAGDYRGEGIDANAGEW